MTPADYIQRLQSLDVHEVIQDTLLEVRPIIIQAQREQMLSSKLSTGTPILPKYSPAYAKKKGYTDPDLRLTGEMQDEIFADIRENIIVIDSADDPDKVSRLVGQYGPDIFGLNEDAIETVQMTAEPVFYEKINELL